MEMTFKRKRVGAQFALTAIAATVASSFYLTPAFAQDQDQAAADNKTDKSTAEPVATIIVTGSRIRRVDTEGALPVTTITREEIDKSGYVSLSEVLRNTTLNSFGSFRQQSGSSIQSVSDIDIHGLGSSRTLVLIDGRRAPKDPTSGEIQNLNIIPLAAVDHIEVLTDGASAIYGSDAIAGVVNVILKKDFQGVEFKYGAGNPSAFGGEKGGNTHEASAVMGITSDKGSLMIGAGYNDRQNVFVRDRPWGANRGASLFSNNYYDPVAGDFKPVPGGCAGLSPDYYINPTNGRCAYDFNAQQVDDASLSNRSLFVSGEYKISDNWSTYVTGSIANTRTEGIYAPSLNDIPIIVPGSVSGIDYNGDGTDDDVYLYHRFAALGNRVDNVDGNNYDITAGTKGTVGTFDIDVGARYDVQHVNTIGHNYVVLPIAAQYIASGQYDIRDPFGADPDILNAMKTTITRVSEWTERDVYGSASTPLFPMAGGNASLAFGGEWRSEDYSDQYDSLSEAGAVGGSAGSSAGGGRIEKAVYVEALFPVIPNLNIDTALRYDKYSDYGHNVSPKISIDYKPIDMLKLRAAYGQGFRAPTLDLLTQKPAFSAEDVTSDKATCENGGYTWNGSVCSNSVQVNSTSIANPDLGAEKSKQITLGMVLEPTTWFDASLDYWHIKISDVITQFTTDDLASRAQAGDSIPAGLGICRSPTPNPTIPDDCVDDVTVPIRGAIEGYANFGTLKVQGLSLKADTKFRFGAFGKLTTTLAGDYYLSYKENGGRDEIGDPGQPEFRATLSNTYYISSFQIAYNINYTDKTAVNVIDGKQVGSVPSWTTHDIQVAYTTPWDGTLAVGATNLFNRLPENKPYDGRPYNFYLYDAYGRTPYFSYTQRF